MQVDQQEQELVALRRQLAEQQEELERLRAGRLGRPSRRALLTGGAAVAGGVLAHAAASATPAHAVDGHDIPYPVMGETAHLFLAANGTSIPGDSTQTSLGREDSIECFYFQQKVRSVVTKRGETRQKYDDVVIRKRVDKATPRIAQAHDTRAKLTGDFKFFRPSPTGDGTTEQFFTISFSGGRVMWRDVFLPDLAVAGGRGGYGGGPPFEEIGMRLSGLSWTFEDGDISWG